MIWIDDEVVFARLNALLTVTKEATDRVIEAALRAEKKATNEMNPEIYRPTRTALPQALPGNSKQPFQNL